MWSDWLVVCDCGFSLSALWCSLSAPIILLGFLLPWTWGISSRLLQQSTAAAPYFGLRSGCSWWLTEVRVTAQETGIKTITKKKKCKKAKWLSEEGLQIAVKRREAKSKGEKERYKHLNAEFQRITRRDKAFLSHQCKEIEENNKMGKTRDSSRKLEIPREHFMQRWAR